MASSVWHNSKPQAWDADVARFYAGLLALDERLASGYPLKVDPGESSFKARSPTR